MTDDTVAPVAAGPVQLHIPPDPALSRVLRLTVGAMASIGPFTLDEIDDVKIAISEMLIALIEHGDGGSIDIDLDLAGADFTLVATTDAADVNLAHPDLTLCRTVLDGVASEQSIATDAGRLSMRAVLRASN
jgi:hypothetical protein